MSDDRERERPVIDFGHNLKQLRRWLSELCDDEDTISAGLLAWACHELQESADLRRQLDAAREAMAEIEQVARSALRSGWTYGALQEAIHRIRDLASGVGGE